MSKCNRCGVNIVDNTDSCPLCHHVLVREAEEKDNMYPDARVLTRRFRFLENIVLFLSIVIGVTLMTVEYLTSDMIGWSIMIVFRRMYVNVLV